MKAGVIDVDIENPDIKIPQTLEIPINDRLAGARDKSTNKRKAIKVYFIYNLFKFNIMNVQSLMNYVY